VAFDSAGNILVPDPRNNNHIHKINPITGELSNIPADQQPKTL
jgi:hypothetical protein